MELFSPAKINLFLRVLGKRPDGYHSIASLIQAVDLGDMITINPAPVDQITCNECSIPVDEKNLVWKARELFRKKTGADDPVSIHIHKNIPVEAGLGGGSSNAATVIWGLNKLFETYLSAEAMKQWSLSIGSDVPFFFSRGTAYCQGRGEIVEDIEPIKTIDKIWIVKPQFSLSTPSVYKHMIPEPAKDPALLLEEWQHCRRPLVNDLEKPANLVNPMVSTIKNTLYQQGFEEVLLSGSGSSFFCIGRDEPPKIDQAQIYGVNRCRRENSQWYRRNDG